jgi:hypothetical protein
VRPKALLPILAALLVALAGCGMFSTRPAQPPGGDIQVPPDFTSPDSLLATLVRAIRDRSTTNFGLALADTLIENREFHAVFDPADIIEWQAAGHPNYPSDWRRNDELTLFPQFVANFPDSRYETYFTVDDNRGGKRTWVVRRRRKYWNMHYRVWSGSIPVAAARPASCSSASDSPGNTGSPIGKTTAIRSTCARGASTASKSLSFTRSALGP